MLTVVATPTRLPERLARSATVTSCFLSLSSPMAPLYVFTPVDNAVPAAEESVTELVPEKVVATPATGN
ncbi:hypothetical protein SDC9_193037 [bioreactor metagenome]|uniref:Uncharacterized protein n=1 Tax=bioreactor metagenome TaxID=1076179 RepID=A0A645I2T5_9ZZZZ